MQNIEMKACYGDFEYARQCVRELGGQFSAVLHQKDIYFNARKGRLKLRTIAGKGAWLIQYQREDESGPRLSRFELFPVDEPRRLELVLSNSLGVLCTVTKKRELHKFENVRIHLDIVDGLGKFLEFEALMDERRDPKVEQAKVAWLRAKFMIPAEAVVAKSYLDLMLAQAGQGEDRDGG